EDEYLAVADLPGIGGLFDRFDHAVEEVIAYRGFHLYFRQEINDVFGAAIELGVPLLPPESLDLRDGDALHADGREGLADLVELERLDDGGYQFHDVPSLLRGRSKGVAVASERLLDVDDAGILGSVVAGE